LLIYRKNFGKIAMKPYLSEPQSIATMPKGIPYIIANEAAERFSYYGMRAILVIFMTQYMTNASGKSDVMSEQEAQGYFHLFVSAVYFMPVFGAFLSDGLLGKYKTIILLSLVYCAGHFALALDSTRMGLLLGQGLIAIGAGGIKPCVSAHVGDQFGTNNQHLLGTVFSWFYFAINFGAFASMLIVPWLLAEHGPAWAFGVPGLLMLAATLLFWLGRYQFIHRPPAGIDFIKQLFSQSGWHTLSRLLAIYVFIAIFWALFEQIGSSWVLQAARMDRVIGGFELLPSQIQAANPLLIMLLTPLFTYCIYPWLNTVTTLTDLKKIAIGLFLTVVAFGIASLIQMQLDVGNKPCIIWQLVAYVILTSSEVMVSITCLEFSYRQAPETMKSLIMSIYLLSISMGNLLTGVINFLIENPDGSSQLAGASYFWFFTGLMLITAVLFAWISRFFVVDSTIPS
jgi:proton-dependent oligopeptide transporter, POT family